MPLHHIFWLLFIGESILTFTGHITNPGIYFAFAIPTLFLAVVYHRKMSQDNLRELEKRIIKYLNRYEEGDSRTVRNFLNANRILFYIACENLIKEEKITLEKSNAIYDGTEFVIYRLRIKKS